MKKIIILSILLMLTGIVLSQENLDKKTAMKTHDISMYPSSVDGFSMFTITLEAKDNEADYQIELYAGKMAAIDCNNHRLLGEFSKQTVNGWGYSYYEFKSNGELMSTLRACPDNSKHQEFVKSSTILVRYNSKLPIVVYLPNNISLKYKIWERGEAEFEAKEQ